MVKVKKPTGLIKYNSVSEKKVSLKHPRSIAYLVLIFASISGLAYNIVGRQPLEAAIIRAKDTPYQVLPNENGEPIILNHFKLHISNQGFIPGKYEMTAAEEFAKMGLTVTTAEHPIQLISGQSKIVHVFLKFPASLTNQSGQFKAFMRIQDLNPDNKGFYQDKEVVLVGPVQK